MKFNTVLFIIFFGWMTSLIAKADVVTYPCGPAAGQQKMCDYLDARFAKENPGNTAKRVTVPWSSNEQLTLYQQMFAAGSSDLDVINLDVTWPGLLADSLADLTSYKGDTKYFEVYSTNNVVNNKLVALPQFADISVLLYRKDLLEKYNKPVPQTWDELYETAKFIMEKEREAGNSKMWGFVFQGKAYEGLTCNTMEWIASYGGGNVVEPDGTISVNNKQAAKALDKIASFVGTITPKGVLGYMEEEARGVFQNGNAVFMRNWPYSYNLSQKGDSPIKGKVGFTILPKGEGVNSRSASALGGWALGVNKYSKHIDLAAKFVKMSSDEGGQLARNKFESQTPSIENLFVRQDMQKVKAFLPMLKFAVARPSTVTKTRYNQVSKEIWNASFSVLSGAKTGTEAVKDLASKLKRIKKRAWK